MRSIESSGSPVTSPEGFLEKALKKLKNVAVFVGKIIFCVLYYT